MYMGIKVEHMATIQYLIKWKGYAMDECTWEPKKNILDKSMVLLSKVQGKQGVQQAGQESLPSSTS